MKKLFFLIVIIFFGFLPKAQIATWTFKDPVITIDFGTGNIRDLNTIMPQHYQRVGSSCPSDGHYTYTSFTKDCFFGDWFTLIEDHTSGDAGGNMMLVNSSYNEGIFFRTNLDGLKGGTTYEFSVWMMNVCKISDKCPYPLLPNITMRLQTPSGKSIAQFSTGEVFRPYAPAWKQYRAIFATPSTETSLTLIMVNNAPGGCGNDFAMDDITIREAIIPTRKIPDPPKRTEEVKKQPVKSEPKKNIPSPVTAKNETDASKVQKNLLKDTQAIKLRKQAFPPPPPLLATRTNSLIQQLETEAGEINLELYDNGEIDNDTVSIYHNNVLVVSHARLSEKPIRFRVAVNPANPYHELVMVAENLGSIPPNTSVMIVTAGSKLYKVFISSTKQKNAKVVLHLKE